jgi:outer membrane protein assembly factor BamB
MPVRGSMTTQAQARPARRELRLWPGIALATAVLLARYVGPALFPRLPEVAFTGVLVGALGGILVLLWWLLLSRAPWRDRLAAVVVVAAAFVLVPMIVDPSISTGAMGMLFYVLSIPLVAIALPAWAWATRGLPDTTRRIALVAAIFGTCGTLAFLRTGGFDSNFDHDFAWRWSKTAEQRLVEAAASAPVPSTVPAPPTAAAPPPAAPTTAASASASPAATPAVTAETPAIGTAPAAPAAALVPAPAPVARRAEWPGFRGARRDGVVEATRIATDWAASPPVELWKRAIGPGWSSFAVDADRIYTQEQRGEEEVVACYRLSTGEPIWMHRDRIRFWESNAGAGPRATPLLHGGRLYALGATGHLNALDAATGAPVWSRDAAADTKAKLPMWGFSGSPIAVGDAVIVAASGVLASYDLATGRPRWMGEPAGEGYSSPQLVTIDGVPQVLLVSGDGMTSVSPADGKVLWSHPWKGYPMVQPASTADGGILFSHNDSDGLRRLAVQRGASGWTASERWTSKGLKPYFNDFVVHNGHAYGFDGAILSCVNLKDGERKWKGGRYGNGQMVLLAAQDLLLVLSEEGEIALVKATPDAYAELARVPGIDGKTWNHPVVVGDVLLARNGEQMAAFRLPSAAR